MASTPQLSSQDKDLNVARLPTKQTNASGNPPDKEDDSMLRERLSRLEGVIDGLKHVQTQMLVAIGIVAAFVVGFGFYTLTRIDSLSDRISAMPAQISTDLRDITKTLAESITAAKQQPSHIIVIPEKNFEQKKQLNKP